MKKGIIALFVILIVMTVCGCHLFEQEEVATVNMYFESANAGVHVGGIVTFTLKIDPPDGFGNIVNVEYTVIPESVGYIYGTPSRSGVSVYANDAGTAIVKARVMNNECIGIMTVRYP